MPELWGNERLQLIGVSPEPGARATAQPNLVKGQGCPVQYARPACHPLTRLFVCPVRVGMGARTAPLGMVSASLPVT